MHAEDIKFLRIRWQSTLEWVAYISGVHNSPVEKINIKKKYYIENNETI